MKTGTLLIVTVFLIIPKISFGDDNSQIENSQVNEFSDYINSSQGPVKNPVDNKVKPLPVTKNNSRENSKKAGPEPVLKAIPHKWTTCTIDSDCTAAVADCVSWDPLNKKYLEKMSKNLDACSESVDPGFQPVTVCVDKECKTTEKTTDVSWEDWLSQMHKGR